MNKPPNVVDDPEAPIAPDIMAAAIVEISKGMRRTLAGRLNQEALELLIHHATTPRISRRDIRIVMNAIAALERAYVRNRRRSNLDRRKSDEPAPDRERRDLTRVRRA